MAAETWREDNRRNWDERVAIHIASPFYDLASLRAGKGHLQPIEDEELGPVDGLSVLHLQCHFGRDTLALAQRGATVTGVDFSPKAITAAKALTEELGLSDRATFILSDVYDAASHIEPGSFDRVFITWGTIYWLPDLKGWANVIASALKPGGQLYFAEGHPAALVFDTETKLPDGRPGYFVPYFNPDPMIFDDPSDYADPDARLENSRTCEWMHTVSDILTALLEAGLRIDRFTEHDCVPWAMFDCLVKDEHHMFYWPNERWLPLSLTITATKAG